jgi:hypothetical protein
MLPRSAVALLVVVACRAPVTLVSGDGELRVTPSSLDFGSVARGDTAKRTLTLQNTSLSPLSVHATTSGPFDVAPDVRVEGGASIELEVRFTPVDVGDAPGTLDLAWNDTHLDVPLHGRGVDCPPVATCQVVQLQGDTCVAVQASDGAACAAACLTDATCQGGACVGRPRSCDDGNSCTLDTCDPNSGCNHVDLACVQTSACQRPTGTCDPTSGCGLEPVDDGTPCGDSACAWADICIGGTCQRRPTPNADVDCHYTDVVAGENFTCALTRSGHVRCWGDMVLWASFDPAPLQEPAPPTTMPGFSNIVAIAADHDFCAIDASGAIHCGRSSIEPSGGTVVDPVGLNISYFGYSMVVSSNGVATRWRGNGPLTAFDGGVIHGVEIDDDIWVLDANDHLQRYDDFFIQDHGAVAPGSKLASFGQSIHWRLAVIAPDGTVELGQNAGADGPTAWGAPLDALGGYRWDAGAITVGGSLAPGTVDIAEYACAAQRGGVIICRTWDSTIERRYQVPGELVKLTARGTSHVCALNDLGDIWCFGENRWGELGEAPFHSEPQWLDTPVSSMTVGFTITNGALYQWRDDSWLWPWGQELISSDGGTEWTQPRQVGTAIAAAFTGGTPLLLDGDQLFRWTGTTLRPLATGIVRCGDLGAKGCQNERSSQWACLDARGQTAFYGGTCLDGGQPTDGCALVEDGGVNCDGAHVALPGAATVLSTMGAPLAGCALLPTGEVRCWDHAADVPQPIAGLGPGVRQLAGSLASGCAVVGPNTVKCWGDNSHDQVGPQGPSTPAMSTRVFDEPVVRLMSKNRGNVLTGLCVQLQSGRAGCWGHNPAGELGPTLMRSQLPVQVVK